MSTSEGSGFSQWDHTDEAFERERSDVPPIIPPGSGPPGPDASASIIFASTTPSLQGWTIRRYLGVVCGEAAIGTGFGTSIAQAIDSFCGSRSVLSEGRLREARVLALQEMAADAGHLGANAVVGIDIDYEYCQQAVILVSASGTAVFVEQESDVPAKV